MTDDWSKGMSLSQRYEKFLVPIIMDRWARRMVQNVEPEARVLDAGCGTGIVSRYAVLRTGKHGRITGLDMSLDMLCTAQALSVTDSVCMDWVEGDACCMPLKSLQFDIVLSQFSLMFMADKESALAEMQRVLKHGGVLKVAVFVSGPFDQALRRVLGKHVVPDENGFAIWNCSDLNMLTSLVVNAGFDILTVEERSTPSCYESIRQSIDLMKDWNGQIASLSESDCEQIIADLEVELQDHVTDNGFACPEPVAILSAKAR